MVAVPGPIGAGVPEKRPGPRAEAVERLHPAKRLPPAEIAGGSMEEEMRRRINDRCGR